jgi:hypothetical protein
VSDGYPERILPFFDLYTKDAAHMVFVRKRKDRPKKGPRWAQESHTELQIAVFFVWSGPGGVFGSFGHCAFHWQCFSWWPGPDHVFDGSQILSVSSFSPGSVFGVQRHPRRTLGTPRRLPRVIQGVPKLQQKKLQRFERKREGEAKVIPKQSEGKAKAKWTSIHWFLQVLGFPRFSKTVSEDPKKLPRG